MIGQLVTLTRAEALRVAQEGAQAAEAGLDPRECPYYGGAEDANTRLRAQAWTWAFVHRRGPTL
jgi:hypothetical protein